MPNKYLDSVGLAEYTSLIKAELAPKNSPALTGTPTAPTPTAGDNSTKIATTAFVNTKAGNYLPLAGGTLTGNVYTTPYYDSTIVDPEGGQTLIVSKGKVAKGTAPSNNEWHTMVMAVDNSGLTSNANKYGQVETGVKTDGSVETTVQAYKNEANSTTSAKISVGYDANGNAFTSAPTPTAGDNSTKIATTAFVNTKAGNYLPLAGGTMTGAIIRRGDFVFCNADDAFVRLSGGSEYTHGASLQLNGQDSTSVGRFALMARKSGVGTPALVGEPNGTLTWNDTKLAYETSAIRAVSSLVSTSGSNTATFELRGNSALIAVKRGANAQLFMCDYWTANSVTLSSVGSAIATVTKTANSNTVTITNKSSSAISVQIVSGANLL